MEDRDEEWQRQKRGEMEKHGKIVCMCERDMKREAVGG